MILFLENVSFSSVPRVRVFGQKSRVFFVLENIENLLKKECFLEENTFFLLRSIVSEVGGPKVCRS